MKKHILSFVAASLITLSSISYSFAAGLQPADETSSTDTKSVKESRNQSHHQRNHLNKKDVLKNMEALNLTNDQRIRLEKELARHVEVMSELKKKRHAARIAEKSGDERPHVEHYVKTGDQNGIAKGEPHVKHFKHNTDQPDHPAGGAPAQQGHTKDGVHFRPSNEFVLEMKNHQKAISEILTPQQLEQLKAALTPRVMPVSTTAPAADLVPAQLPVIDPSPLK